MGKDFENMKRFFALMLLLFMLVGCAMTPIKPSDFKLTTQYPAEFCVSVSMPDITFRAHCRMDSDQSGELTFVTPETLADVCLYFDAEKLLLKNGDISTELDAEHFPDWLLLLLLQADETFRCEQREESGIEVYCLKKDSLSLYFEKETKKPLCLKNEEKGIRVDFIYE